MAHQQPIVTFVAAALSVIALSGAPAFAQKVGGTHGVGAGHGAGPGHTMSARQPGGYRGGFYGPYGRGYYGYPYGYGIGFGFGYGYGWPYYGYPYPNYAYAPNVCYEYLPPPTIAVPAPTSGTVSAPAATVETPLSEVTLNVHAPAEASVLINGVPTRQSGPDRAFTASGLEPGRTYSFDVRATWKQPDGTTVQLERRVVVQAGDRRAIDFDPRTRDLAPVSAPANNGNP